MKQISEIDLNNWLASEDEQDPAVFPELYNLSAAFMFRFLARPNKPKRPEFLYIPIDGGLRKRTTELAGVMGQWNLAWESAQLRPESIAHRKNWNGIFKEILPDLSALNDRNVYLLPDSRKRFDAYLPLYAMLPLSILKRFKLPPIRRMIWPTLLPCNAWEIEPFLPHNFINRLSRAFATYIWTFIGGASSLGAFSPNEPLHLLSHNLDFWLPHATRVAEERLATSEFVDLEEAKDREDLEKIRALVPPEDDVTIDRCRKGGHIWLGELDAREAASEMVDMADKNDRLQSLIDAIRSNRVEEDFSNRWSFAREDF